MRRRAVSQFERRPLPFMSKEDVLFFWFIWKFFGVVWLPGLVLWRLGGVLNFVHFFFGSEDPESVHG